MYHKLVNNPDLENHDNNLEALITSGDFQKVTRYFLNHSEDFINVQIKSIDDLFSKLDKKRINISEDSITSELFKKVIGQIFANPFQPISARAIEKVLRFFHKLIDHEITGSILAGPEEIRFSRIPCYFPCVTEVTRDQNIALNKKVEIIYDTIKKVLEDLPVITRTIPKNFQFTFIYFSEMFNEIAKSKEVLSGLIHQISDARDMTTSEIMNKLIRSINSDFVNNKMMTAFIKEYNSYDGIPIKEIEFIVFQIMFQYELKEPYDRELMDHVILKASDNAIDKSLKDNFYQYLKELNILGNNGNVLRELSPEQENELKEKLLLAFKEIAGQSKEFLIHDYHRSLSPYTKGGSRFYNYFNMANNFSIVMDLLLDYLNQIGGENYVEKSNIAGKVIIKDWLAPYYDFTMFSEAETFLIDQKNTLSGSTTPLSKAAENKGVNLISLNPGSFQIFKEYSETVLDIKINPRLTRLYFADGIISLRTGDNILMRDKSEHEQLKDNRDVHFGSLEIHQGVYVENNINSIDDLHQNQSRIGLTKMEYIMNSSVMDLPTYEAYLIYYGLAVEQARNSVALSLIDITAENDFRGYTAREVHNDGRIDDGISWELNHPEYQNLEKQLKALVTLALKYPEKDIEIIIPKVRNVEEVKYVYNALMEQLKEITGSVEKPRNLQLGMMVETLTLLNNEIFQLYDQAKPLDVNIINQHLRLADNDKDDLEIKKMLMNYFHSLDLIDENGYPVRSFTRNDSGRLKNFLDSLYEKVDENLYILLKDIVIGACEGFMEKRRAYLDELFNQQNSINKVEDVLLLKGNDGKPLIKKIIIGSNRLDQSIKGQLRGMKQEGSYSYIFFIIMRNLSETIANINRLREEDPLKVAVCGKSASDERFVPVMLSFFPDNELHFATKNPDIYSFLKRVANKDNLDQARHLIQEIINKKDSTYTILQKLDNLTWNIF